MNESDGLEDDGLNTLTLHADARWPDEVRIDSLVDEADLAQVFEQFRRTDDFAWRKPRCCNVEDKLHFKKGAQRRRIHCALEPRRSQKFSPRRRPSRGRGPAMWSSRAPGSVGESSDQWPSAGNGHYFHLQTQFGEDRCTQFRVIVVTDPQTNTHTQRTGAITIHCTTA